MKAPVQYNAVMLIRILTDNPGPSFTKNMDAKFVETVKLLLRQGRDPSVQQILRETLVAMEHDKAYDTNLNPLFNMWRKECAAMTSPPGVQQMGSRTLNAPPWNPNGAMAPSPSARGIPPPAELAARIEEARTSAKLLLQLVQSTPPQELLKNDLVKEFAQRCASAARSIEGYISADSPAPDEDTMLTLIETSEQLSVATSKHHRAVLQARRATTSGASTPLSQASPPPQAGAVVAPPPGPPPSAPATQTASQESSSLKGLTSSSALPTLPARKEPPSSSASPAPLQLNLRKEGETSALENPFADHHAADPRPSAESSNPPRRVSDDPAISPSSLYGNHTLAPGRDREASEGTGTVISAVSDDNWPGDSGTQRSETVSPMDVRTVTYRF
jgi:hypothetical protein